jgi:RNA polymerase sigma-70 factor (ECF subfamily)
MLACRSLAGQHRRRGRPHNEDPISPRLKKIGRRAIIRTMRQAEFVPLEAIEAAYRADFQRYLHVATAITRNRDVAADAVQEAFATAIQKHRQFRGDGPIGAWLWRLVVNSARRSAARTSRDRRNPPEAAVDAAVRGAETDAGAAVRAALAGLPERQRLAMFLRYYGDLGYAEIAGALGVSQGTVASTLHTGHAALLKELKEVSA